MRARWTVWLVTGFLLVGASACGGGSSSSKSAAGTSTTAPSTKATSGRSASSVGPCSLLTLADIQTFDSRIQKNKLDTVASTKICAWLDPNGIPEVQVQVNAPPSGSLKQDLSDNLNAFGGYDIVDVPGLGDEAAAGFQKADPSKGLKAGLADLEARKGDLVVGISLGPDAPDTKQGSPEFDTVKQLMAKALAALG